MKVTFVAIAAVAQVASAHYFFDVAIPASGSASKSFQYIRNFTRPTKYNPIKLSSNPAVDIRDNSFIDKGDDSRCNQGAFSAASKTEILEVKAGENLTFKLAVGATMQHPGPSLVYMSKAPNGVKAYDGSGDWFKIYEDAVCSTSGDFTKGAWCSYDKNTITATIPKDTPDGEYLYRVEHIGIHKSHVNQPEHFVSCAQIKVTGGGSGTPGPVVKFPGAYKSTDPYANFSIYGGHKPFTIPGPAVWTGGSTTNSTGSSSGSGDVEKEEGSTTTPANPSTAPSAPATSASAPSSAQSPTGGCAQLYA